MNRGLYGGGKKKTYKIASLREVIIQIYLATEYKGVNGELMWLEEREIAILARHECKIVDRPNVFLPAL